jgi:hypothetical protein
MMGRLKSDQSQLFYEFHLSEAVPEDHLVRKIDATLDLPGFVGELASRRSIGTNQLLQQNLPTGDVKGFQNLNSFDLVTSCHLGPPSLLAERSSFAEFTATNLCSYHGTL